MYEQAALGDGESVVAVEPRLTVVLHPNTSRIDIALNDRLFNTEKYSFSRKNEPTGRERELLDYCETYIVGIGSATASKNVLQLEIEDGVLLREFIPQVITACKRWGSAVEPYNPVVCVDNRRFEIEPVYGEDDSLVQPGRRQLAHQADIGLPYSAWTQGA
jgi:hypothetical protein